MGVALTHFTATAIKEGGDLFQMLNWANVKPFISLDFLVHVFLGQSVSEALKVKSLEMFRRIYFVKSRPFGRV